MAKKNDENPWLFPGHDLHCGFSSSIWSWRVEEKWSPKRCGKGEIYHNFSHVFEVKSRIIPNAFIAWSAVDFSVIVLNPGRAANSWLRASGIPFRWLKSQWNFLLLPPTFAYHNPFAVVKSVGEIQSFCWSLLVRQCWPKGRRMKSFSSH